MTQVKIIETKQILPSSPPFAQTQTLPLSHIDNDPNLRLTFRYLRAYAAASPPRNPLQVIAAALSTALLPYYPLAGTLLRRDSDHRLELLCLPGKGVPLVNAAVDCTLESVNFLDGLDPGFLERLVPDPTRDEGLINPCVLQVTVFGCGGWTLGAAIHNSLCDGLGAALFFNLMAETARGAGGNLVEAVWDRTGLLGPREPPRVEGPVREFLGLEKGFEAYGQDVGPVGRECFRVTDESMDRLKSFMLEKSGLSFTTFEALGAFIWRAKVKASKLPSDETVKFAYLLNIRRILNPPLPRGYWGNGCVTMYAKLRVTDLTDQPLWKTAELIRKSKSNAGDEYIRSLIDFHELHYEDGITAGRGVSGFTDWRHLGHSSVDFGWGGPVTVLPLSKKFLGSVEPCFFLPCSTVGGKGEGGFKVLVAIREAAREEFREEMEKFSKGEFDGPV